MQSTFSPFGAGAQETLRLTVILAGSAAVILIAVLSLSFYAMRQPEHSLSHHGGMRMVLWLGAIGPACLLAILLLFALPAMRPMAVAQDDLRIAVDGRQFWWNVSYRPPGANAVTTANEIRVPVGRTVQFDLTAQDVVHSFWIPGLAGKMDMLPGRTNHLVVRATKAGNFRGVCAEFCGLSHALMAFDVIAMEPAAFDRWLAAQAATPRQPPGRGRDMFVQHGCTACHRVEGVSAEKDNPIGPDLRHFGSRTSVAAGILPMREEAIAAFIRDPAATKPGARMPASPDMTPQDARVLARYLMELR